MSKNYLTRGSKRNFFQVSNLIFDLELNLSSSSLLVYLYINRLANNETKKAFPSIRKIADKCKLNKDTVIKAINELMAVGLLDKRFKPGQVNTYIIFDPEDILTAEVEKKEEEQEEPANDEYIKEMVQKLREKTN